MELILEVDSVVARGHHEAWGFSGASYLNVLQPAVKFAGRGKNPVDPIEYAEIRSLECVVSGNRRCPGLARFPWPETAACLGLSGWFGIRNKNLERHSPGTPDILQFS